MRLKTIFIFAKDRFERDLKNYLTKQNYLVAYVEPEAIYSWQFKLMQDIAGNHSGIIHAPNGVSYDLSDVIGIYFNKFNMQGLSEYEHNAWHGMFSWLAYTLPNALQNYKAMNNFNMYKIQAELLKHKISLTTATETHYAHCIDDTLFASTVKLQMAILPPKLAKMLLHTLKAHALNCGQFKLRFEAGSWFCCDFSPIPEWEDCAFPSSFLYQEIFKLLTKIKKTPWLKCNAKNDKIDTIPNEAFITPDKLPRLNSASYQPSIF